MATPGQEAARQEKTRRPDRASHFTREGERPLKLLIGVQNTGQEPPHRLR
jgi:hypothetical protein